MEQENGAKNVTIAEIARRAGVSSATVSYVISDRQDVKIAKSTRERILTICKELGYQKGARRKPPSKKRVTIDDIAREAGVSTATVSYIVNGRTDVKIGEETRRKVLQICNLRQYTPSPVARLLAGKKNNLIGICAPQSEYPAQNAHYYALLQQLQLALRRKDYGAVLLTPSVIQEMHMQENLEGIICVDLTEEEFYALKENWFVPIVAVDMIVSDPLFFKVYTDHGAVIAAAKQLLHSEKITYVAYPYRNAPYLNDLKAALQQDTLCLAGEISALRAYVTAHPDDAFVFGDRSLAELCAPFLPDGRTVCITETEGTGDLCLPLCTVAKQAVEMLQSAIRREETKPHTFKLAPMKG